MFLEQYFLMYTCLMETYAGNQDHSFCKVHFRICLYFVNG